MSMSVRLIVPGVNTCPFSRPQQCPHCHSLILHIHQKVTKQAMDPQIHRVQALGHKCRSVTTSSATEELGVEEKMA